LIKIDKYNDVEFKEIPKDEECMVTAVKIGEIINEPASRVRKWAEYHEDNLYIKKVNGRFAYTQKSIDQFKFIKELKQEKNMTHEQIRQHMNKHGMQYSQYDGGLIDPKDPFGYEALSSAISQKTEKQLKEFLVNFVQYQEKNNKELVKAVTIEVEQTVQEQLEDSMSGIQKELESQREENKKLSEQLNSIQKEIAVTQDLNLKMDNLKILMEQRKKESEEQPQHQGFFEKLFGKKK
jgi:hypothetical protein